MAIVAIESNGKPYRAIEWWHFWWPWVTPTPSFKVTLQFEGE